MSKKQQRHARRRSTTDSSPETIERRQSEDERPGAPPSEWLSNNEAIHQGAHKIPHSRSPPAGTVCETCRQPSYDNRHRRWTCACRENTFEQTQQRRWKRRLQEDIYDLQGVSSAETTPATSRQTTPAGSPPAGAMEVPELPEERETGVRARERLPRDPQQERRKANEIAKKRNTRRSKAMGLDGAYWMDETAYAEATRNLPERISSDEEEGMRSHEYYLITGAIGTAARDAAALRTRELRKAQAERATQQAAAR